LVLNNYYVGISKKNITPQKSMVMAGYIARKYKSSCKIDDLYVRSLFIEDEDNNKLLVILFDLIHVDNELYKTLINKLSDKVKLRENEIHVVATHTHSGPEVSIKLWNTLPLTEEDKEEIIRYRNFIVEKAIETTMDAINNVEKTKLFIGKSYVENVASNRIDPKGPIDPEVTYIFGKNNNKINFLALNYACHPTVLGPENTCISGDLAGYTAKILEEKLNTIVFYFNGAAGNISTRYTRKSRNLESLKILAYRIADPIYESITKGKYEEIKYSKIKTETYDIRLRTKKITIDIVKVKRLLEELEKQVEYMRSQNKPSYEIRNIESRIEGLKVLLYRADEFKELNKVEAHIGYALIGDYAIMIFFPGEAYVELQLMIKGKSKYPYVFFIGYANGYIGYVPISKYEVKETITTYEELVSIINPADIHKIMEVIEKIITQ
jgi:neutral ceramidase